MRPLVAVFAIAALAMGCAAPAPTATPVTPTAAATLLTAQPTDPPTPLPTMPAFGDPYPAPELGTRKWAVVASVDATRSPQHVVSTGQAKAGAIIDAAFACEHATQITFRATDARTGNIVVSLSAPCRPGEIGRGTFTPDGNKMTVNLEAASTDPAVRFWVKLAVTKDNYLP